MEEIQVLWFIDTITINYFEANPRHRKSKIHQMRCWPDLGMFWTMRQQDLWWTECRDEIEEESRRCVGFDQSDWVNGGALH